MKYKINLFLLVVLISRIFAVGEAGAVFLLINPGSKAAGAGEAQVAKADDAYASYYNPAGLGFLRGEEVVMQHVNWLPNLTSDIFYDFLAYRKSVSGLGTFGGHIIFLNLGTQQGMDEWNNYTGEFKSYMAAINLSYGTQLSENKSIGMNVKVFHQKLSDRAQAGETGDPFSTDFGFDIGYLQKFGKRNQHQFGFSIQNIGPPIDFIDAQQADPAPTNMRLGVYAELYKDEQNKLNFLFDANKLLVASYPSMDWNGDGIISGSKEEAHSDPWYKGVFTAWLDDWYYGGDYDLCEDPCGQSTLDDDIIHSYGVTRDSRIGGYFALPNYSYINNDKLYKQYQQLRDRESPYLGYYDNNELYNTNENHSENNDAGLPNYFSAEWHEDYDLNPTDDQNTDGVEDWINSEYVYPSYTKIYSLEGGNSTAGYLNSLDFLIKHFPAIVESKLDVVTDEIVYLPNYKGFCEEVYTSAGGYYYENGNLINSAQGNVYGHSMCYSLDENDEGQPYYSYNNIGSYSSPEWIRIENDDFNMSELKFLDLPHDGMGEFDKFDYVCDIDSGNCNAYYKGQVIADNTEGDCTSDTNNDGIFCGPGDNGIDNDELTLVDNSYSTNGQFYYDIEIDEDTIEDLYGPNLYNYFGEKEFEDPRYGKYNAQSNLEKGTGDQREFKNELEEMIYNFGFEWSYTENFIMRAGFIYDLEGDIKNPTFGAGINFDKYGFDFGYTAGDKGHPRENTMFFSLSLGL
tara:strand:+ start:951 stop:3170 length:2220 start_codon:yes stop_codon:yes gene_type:complete